MPIIIIAAIIFLVFYVKANRPIWKMCKGKTPQQKNVIKYVYGGCLTFGKMTDRAYDNLVAKTRDDLKLKDKALNKIGIDEDQLQEIEPVFLEGYSRENPFVKSDGVLRSTWYDTAWLFFSDNQIYMFTYTWDMTSDSKKEKIEEYFYRDVTNINSSSETIEAFEAKGCFGKREKVNRVFTGFSLSAMGDRFTCSTSGSENAESSVSAMKQKLREKKMQMQ